MERVSLVYYPMFTHVLLSLDGNEGEWHSSAIESDLGRRANSTNSWH